MKKAPQIYPNLAMQFDTGNFRRLGLRKFDHKNRIEYTTIGIYISIMDAIK